jgi:hypothetical protein
MAVVFHFSPDASFVIGAELFVDFEAAQIQSDHRR